MVILSISLLVPKPSHWIIVYQLQVYTSVSIKNGLMEDRLTIEHANPRFESLLGHTYLLTTFTPTQPSANVLGYHT